MPQKMLQFVRVDRRMPDKRDAETRRHDFNEIYTGFEHGRAAEQAARCSQCGVPFCQVHCPVHHSRWGTVTINFRTMMTRSPLNSRAMYVHEST